MSRKVNHAPADRDRAWQAHNLSQLLYFRSLSLRTKLEAVEGMAEVVRLLERMRAREREHSSTSGPRDR